MLPIFLLCKMYMRMLLLYRYQTLLLIWLNHFDHQLNGLKVTLIGHSNGGYVALLTAVKDWRIRRIAFLSSVFQLYGRWNGEELIGEVLYGLDSYDAFRYLNLRRSLTRFAWWLLGEGPALHVQRGIANDANCPPGIPCDQVVDMGRGL